MIDRIVTHVSLFGENANDLRMALKRGAQCESQRAATGETKFEFDVIRGVAPGATGCMASEDFVRELRDAWG